MKLSCQENLVKGSSLREKVEKLESFYMALECGIPGDPDELIPRTVKYLRSLI